MNNWIKAGIAASAALATIFFMSKRGSSKSAFAPQPVPRCTEQLALHHGGTRSLSNLNLIVLHSTEGDDAAGAAGWWQDPKSGGSAHIVVDDRNCIRAVPDNVWPWGAMGGTANERGLHIEIAGHANYDPKTGAKAYTREDWLSHMDRLKSAAAIVWDWGQTYGIPMRFLDAEALKRGESGITTHAEVTKAFRVDDHTDPGKAFPIDVFMDLVGGNAGGYVA